MPMRNREGEIVVVIHQMMFNIKLFLLLFMRLYLKIKRRRLMPETDHNVSYSLVDRAPDRYDYVTSLVGVDEQTCRDNLRVNIPTFNRLCYMLEHMGGLRANRNVGIAEQVAIFLHILAHHTKQVVIRTQFNRSTYTISKHFRRVLISLLRLHPILLISPTPVPEDSQDERWKYFKGCLGALDGTYIGARVCRLDMPRYRNRKGEVSLNVLAVCDENMNFIYLLTGWEGSAADSRVLRDAISRPNGLRVPTGNYYLVDNGYTNGNGFLAPYRGSGTRYHLHEFGEGHNAPQNYKEYFNMKHAKARNVIERAFGLLKSRWGILRSPAYYPIKVQNRIVMACSLLHNFIRTTNLVDHEEATLDQWLADHPTPPSEDVAYVGNVESSQQWTSWRDNLALNMYNEWRAGH